jgi:hypothetical protein
MNTTAASIRPRLVRHNGSCAVCKVRVSIGIRAKSALWLHEAVGAVLGAPMVTLPSVAGSVSHVSLDENDCWVPTMNTVPVRECCGRQVTFRTVVGKLGIHKCDARCETSKGHNCECSCGGANHGRAA